MVIGPVRCLGQSGAAAGKCTALKHKLFSLVKPFLTAMADCSHFLTARAQKKQLCNFKDGSNLENVCYECLGSSLAVPRMNKTTILFAVLSIYILFLKALGRPAVLGFGARVDQ